jgi:phosphomannomutase
MIKSSIFKKYDVRGKYPSEIDTHVAEKIIHAYYDVFKPDHVVVGHDPVKGSAKIYDVVYNELSKLGAKVFMAGMVSTPMLYFASSKYQISQGLMLTASHLGPQYTGIKIVVNGIPPEPKQIEAMRDKATSSVHEEVMKDLTHFKEPELLATLKTDYLAKIQQVVGEGALNKYKLAIDVSNGPNGKIIKDVVEKFGLNASVINEEVKAEELAHETNPKVAENRKQLVDCVKQNQAGLGIIWDGDGDRAYFVDQDGEIIAPEFVGAQIGSYLIKNGFGTTMTIDVRGSSAVEKELSKVDGKVKRIQAWHVPIKFEMEQDKDIVFGMETSGHYVFRDLYKADDGLLASLMFLRALQENEKSLKDLLQEFRSQYTILEEINFETQNTEAQISEELQKAYSDGQISTIDGITIDYPEWRFNIRASKTEPIIRLNISGSNSEKVMQNLEKIKSVISGKILDH